MTLLFDLKWEMCTIFPYHLDHSIKIETFKEKSNAILICENYTTKSISKILQEI